MQGKLPIRAPSRLFVLITFFPIAFKIKPFFAELLCFTIMNNAGPNLVNGVVANTASIWQCQTNCKSRSGCVDFNYNTGSKKCFLKGAGNAYPGYFPNGGLLSGKPDCVYPLD